jgi:hypothetical protein
MVRAYFAASESTVCVCDDSPGAIGAGYGGSSAPVSKLW